MTDVDFSDPAFLAQLAELRRHYVAGLPARRAALVAAWAGCVDGGDEAPWLALREVVHKLSGSASSYGLEAVGAAAHDADSLLSGRPPCRRRALVDTDVASLCALLDTAIKAA